ncbi:MAG TPA: ATPase, T2SS/T4P/T4SS family [Tepidisphaeraceae bacterium]|jgi:type II secretory ATPase GspE/PulE/Tfp pilus assembly ATPase PilB-like protein/pSer/pThr/pTyr-binding forkhead associated (FHA) protein|nr:ATPase, T2SS/T4P/T4SS family [Tepidisphaeraceae bacterium]
MPNLFIQIPSAHNVKIVPAEGRPLGVGRLKDNNVVLNDDQVSRYHCVIEKRGPGLFVRDLKSRNGTFVNGERVSTDLKLLLAGDVLRVGAAVLWILDEDSDAPPEDVEALSEDDIVEDSITVDEAMANDLLSLDDVVDDQGPLLVGQFTTDSVGTLTEIVNALPEPRLSHTMVALINARRQVVHPTGPSRGQGRTDAVETLRLVLLICLRNRATDIHLEPKQGQYQIRIRVDGVMVELVRIDEALGVRLAALVKILSDIDIAQRNTVQEGHFSAQVPTVKGSRLLSAPHHVDYRVSFAPAMHGQKLVVRILDTTNAPLRLPDLQMPSDMESVLAKAIQREAGMVLVCGPTGSGKTTSLYALMRSIDTSALNVVTIEDPIEIELPSVTQIPVDEANGKSFSVLLRSLLRQDPDVMLVGEVRDPETARIAMQAAITGHLVFSTVHTKDSVGSIFRLLDLGVEPYLVAQKALHVVLSQRLARQLCPHCKVAARPDEAQYKALADTVGSVQQVYEPRGCLKCLNTGFAGRLAFFELLVVTDKLRDLILKKPGLEEIYQLLSESGFRRLSHNGYELVASGLASFDEIERAATL